MLARFGPKLGIARYAAAVMGPGGDIDPEASETYRPAVRRALICLAIALLTACNGGGSVAHRSADPATGGTLRVGMINPPFFSMDPQREYNSTTWELFRCCLLRTLMSYSDLNGFPGTQPQPDLAAAPPQVSLDGTTWTFRLREGLHYAPPLQDVPITSGDIVRALARLGDPETGEPLLADYFSIIEGFSEYQSGAQTIAGLETPDPLTLRIRESRPDATLPYLLAMAVTAPIPAVPGHPEERFGVASGHARTNDILEEGGYGGYLVASGPYMYEGSASMDFSDPPEEQTPASGYVPWDLNERFFTAGEAAVNGSITLVRNPSWDPATDPLRAALPDRIELVGGTEPDLFGAVDTGDLDLVFDASPPPEVLRSYQNDPELRPLIQATEGLSESLAIFNLAQPPFDDVAVRRAVAAVIDRASLVEQSLQEYTRGVSVLSTHLAPDVTESSLLAGWNPFPVDDGSPDLGAARRAMATSRYARGGRCRDPACDDVEILVHFASDSAVAPLRADLAKLGIHAHFEVTDDFFGRCSDPREHMGICIGLGWQADFPDAVNFLREFFASDGPLNWSHIGAGPRVLRRWGYSVTDVPSVDTDVEQCVQGAGSAKPACWARLDQYLTHVLVVGVPLVALQPLRLSSPRLGAFAWAEAFGEPALDRLPGDAV
jgi:peptide/nickel transport system substrate-binding protein